ncbi:MAG: SDR family oxidoreductase [Hyphomonadaceae bacterium]|nr:SDR family oxidoreductase [Hyphomonadaceae bacterium]
MTKPLDGKVALVTGASRGIGEAIATQLAADGALAAVHYGASADAAHAVVERIHAAGGKAFAIQADLAQPDGVDRLFAALDAELTQRNGTTAIDILVNNAAIAPLATLAETDAATFERLAAVNMRALFFVAQAAAARLRDNGRVINVSSAVTRVGTPGAIAYASTKGFVDSFTRSLAGALGERGVTVNAVAPGVINTDMSEPFVKGFGEAVILEKQALKRLGQPQDVANLVSALAGPGGAWTTGQLIDVSGGSAIAF